MYHGPSHFNSYVVNIASDGEHYLLCEQLSPPLKNVTALIKKSKEYDTCKSARPSSHL